MLKLSKSAAAVVERESIDLDELREFVKDCLTMPSSYMNFDDELYSTHAVLFGTPDIELTSDYLIDYSNYEIAFRDLSAEFPGDVEKATFGHWTYSRFVCLKIRALTKSGKITGAIAAAYALIMAIRDYPALNDEHFSELEYNEWCNSLAREFDFRRDDFDNAVTFDDVDIAAYDLELYQGGEFWISEDDWSELIIAANAVAAARIAAA